MEKATTWAKSPIHPSSSSTYFKIKSPIVGRLAPSIIVYLPGISRFQNLPPSTRDRLYLPVRRSNRRSGARDPPSPSMTQAPPTNEQPRRRRDTPGHDTRGDTLMQRHPMTGYKLVKLTNQWDSGQQFTAGLKR